jgi:sulfate adenylyltransferase subunit 1 (EFTu-like GTPase family)
VQYTRNMVTAASNADAAIVLVDARNGVVEQTRRHLFVSRLLGVRTIVVALNKMDLVGYHGEVAARLEAEIAAYLGGLDLPESRSKLVFVPISALLGDNVVARSDSMPWYQGPPLLPVLESLPLDEDRQDAPARFSVQWIIRPQSDDHRDFRGYAGRVLAGTLRPGDPVTVWPSGRTTRIERIELGGEDLAEARAGRSVTVHLADDLDVGRGDLLSLDGQVAPRLTNEIEADLAWVHASAARVGVACRLKHTAREVRAVIAEIQHGYDVGTGVRVPRQDLALNGIARARIKTAEPLAVDAYGELHPTGSFLLIDPSSGATLAGGMIR